MSTGIPIVSIDGRNKVKLHEDAITQIFRNESIKDLPVCLISMCGPPQTGKSLLLDFFFQYARARNEEDKMADEFNPRVKSLDTLHEQEDQEEQILERGKWKSGVTNGILIWPEILVCRALDKRRVAVLFLETHGAFDDSEDNWKWTNMFVLSTLISSVQILNVSSELTEEQIKLLNVFYEYGATVKDMTGRHALQKFQFVVRDWKDLRKAELGAWGGFNVLQKILKNRKKMYPDEIPIVKRMQSTFLEVGCFLLPHPGDQLAQDPDLNNLSSFNELFIDNVNDLVRIFLSSRNINQKDICGQQSLTRDVETYLRVYVSECMSNPEIPSSSTLVVASSKASHDIVKDEAAYLYCVQMLWICSGHLHLSSSLLKNEHNTTKEMALNHFSTKAKIGGEAFTAKYKREVEEVLDELFKRCARNNWFLRMKYYLIDRMTVTLMLLTITLSTTATVLDFKGKKEQMKYFFIAAQFFAVVLLTYLFLRYRRV